MPADPERIISSIEREAERLGGVRGEVRARGLRPMVCAQDGARLEDPERYYELKLDGVRLVAERDGDRVDLRTRSGRSALAAFPEVAKALGELAARRVVLDGEVVAFSDDGRPSFERLARRIHAQGARRADVAVVYLAFDLLQIGPWDLRHLPLSARKRLLFELVRDKGVVRALDHVEGRGQALFDFCRRLGLVGVVAKRAGSRYVEGPRRGDDWVKLKCRRDAELVVVGWEESDKRALGSLILASYDPDGSLVLRGKVGSGLDQRSIDELLERLRAMATSECAARGALDGKGRRHWVEPRLVASVEYLGFSDGGKLRFPVFRGLRDDVEPRACTVAPRGEPSMAAARAIAEEVAAEAGGRVRLTNQNKIFWPDDGYTKGDLCRYYASVAPALLPHLRDRPIVLVRHPDGIGGKSFHQWRLPKGTPRWLRSFELRDEGDSKRTLVIDDADGLLHVANLGCIPIHVLACRTDRPGDCDFVTIDLDLGEQPLSAAVTVAHTLRELLERLGLRGYPKTSGQRGLHVLVPLGPGVPFEVAKMLCEVIGRMLVARHPAIATMERRVDRRRGKMYVDTGQTGQSRTIVSPYSVRAIAGARVSTPLLWDELTADLDPAAFTIATVPARIATLGDPMADMLTRRPDVPQAVARIEQLLRSGVAGA